MKSGNNVIKIVMWVLFAGILAYFGLYAYHVLFHSYETAALYEYTAEDMAEANVWLFREEQVLKGNTHLEEIVPSEGENVAVGDVISIRYADQDALDRSRQLVTLQRRLDSLEYILTHAADDSDNASLNRSIVKSITGLHSMAVSGDFSNLEASGAELRSLLFRQDYTYNGSTALSKEISELSKEIKSLKKKNKHSTEEVKSKYSGIFSGVVDGYETVLTPEATRRLTISDLQTLTGKQGPVKDTTLGKVITSADWYCAAEVKESDAEKLYEGGTVSLRFNGTDWTVPTRVESISDPENGQVCVVLSSNRYLSELTTLRNQVADLVFNSVSGYRVDKSAIYVDSATGHSGVYRVYGSQAIWVDVDLLWEGEDYYLIRQSPQYDEEGKEISPTNLQAAKQLRPGSEIVISGTGLYDGKVLN